MLDVFTSEQVNVRHAKDLIELQLGSHKIRLYYQTTFEILNGIRVAAKAAMRHEGNKVSLWREFFDVDAPSVVPIHPEYRRSGHTSNLKKWSVSFDAPLVVLQLNELTAKFHYSDAFHLQAWLRVAAKQAKNWAGDTSRALRATAFLSDAEEDVRLGV